MSARIDLRVAALALLVLGIACAEKTLSPAVTLSPRFTIQVTTTARRSAEVQKLWVVAGYFRPPFPGDAPDDSLFVLSHSLSDITGAPQQIDLNVDLTSCLTDPTRHGSREACSLYIGAFLEPSTFDPDTSGWLGGSYDYRLAGPYDATPGHPPAVQAIDLSNSAFAVNHWEADESLQLGGYQAPGGLTGPITGAVGGSGAPTLFALTQGVNAAVGPNGKASPGALLAVFQNGAWRQVNGTSGVNFFVDVAAFAPNDVYLASNDGIGLYHYDGTAIAAVPGVREQLRSVAVSNASPNTKYVIASTRNGASVWLGNPPSFTKYSIAGLTQVDNVCINGPTEAFAASRAFGSSIYRFDGTSWTSVPTSNSAGKVDLQCLGSGQVYVATQGSPGTLYRWNGSGWTAFVGPSGAAGRNMNWAVVSASEIYAVGDSGNVNRAYYRFDGTSWREVGRLSFTTDFSLNRIWADPRGGAAYVSPTVVGSDTRLEMVTPTSVNILTYIPLLRDVVMPTTTSAFVVGRNFFLARWNGARWSVDAPPAGTRTNRILDGVWSTDPANVWAVGEQSTIVRWDGARWNVLSDSTRPIVSPGDNYHAAWGSGGSMWIVGDGSIVRCATPTACATNAQGGGALYGVWGTSAANIYAVGAAGRIVHFDGTTWSSMSSPTGAKLSRVSGSTANDVWAAGDTVVLHFDGSAWRLMTSTVSDRLPFPGYQSPVAAGIPLEVGLWAANAREAYFGTWDGRIRRGEGSNWGTTQSAFQGLSDVTGIAGVAGGCALAITDGLNRNGGGAPRLLRGVGSSGCLAAPMSPPASWP